MEITSFYGTDGCGKSTVAGKLAECIGDEKSVILGGSTYEKWLTPDVAQEFLGDKHPLTRSSADYDKVTLYEDVAIACYGLSRAMADRGVQVIIDSDPYFKRIIWGSFMATSESEAEEYVRHFESRMSNHLDQSTAPDTIVGINMGSDCCSPDELLSRISVRGLVSDHDPTDVGTMTKLDTIVHGIWSEIELATEFRSSRVMGFNVRLVGSTALPIDNPNCDSCDIDQQAEMLAHNIAQTLYVQSRP